MIAACGRSPFINARVHFRRPDARFQKLDEDHEDTEDESKIAALMDDLFAPFDSPEACHF